MKKRATYPVTLFFMVIFSYLSPISLPQASFLPVPFSLSETMLQVFSFFQLVFLQLPFSSQRAFSDSINLMVFSVDNGYFMIS